MTRYDLATVPVAAVWGMVLASPPDQWDAAYAAFYEWQLVGSKDVKLNATISASLTAVTVSLIYSEPADTLKAFAHWRERAQEVNQATGAVQSFNLQHIGASLIEYGNLKGGNPLGLSQGIDSQCEFPHPLV